MIKNSGIALIIIGLVLTIFTTFKFFPKEKVINKGQMEMTNENSNEIYWVPIFGIAIIGVGGAVLWQSNRKK